tara:strand:+ start:3940 stop:5133 length:1194 start_codon:yes stop_codon:yes gene_type:complete
MSDFKIYLITSLSLFESNYNTNKTLYDQILKKYQKINLINVEHFIGIKKNHSVKKIDNKFKDRFNLFNPKNKKEFSEIFLNNNGIILIDMNRFFKTIKVYYFLRFVKLKKIIVSSVGNVQGFNYGIKNKSIIDYLLLLMQKKISPKLQTLLSNLGLISKVDVRFESRRNVIESIKRSKIKSFLMDKDLLFFKNISLINSKSYDDEFLNNFRVEEKFITHLDFDLSYLHYWDKKKKINDEQINYHYETVNLFLDQLASLFNKEIKISIHPLYNLEFIQKYFSKYEIIKYKTPELIRKSFIITDFGSSSIMSAVLLKKKIISLDSDAMRIVSPHQIEMYPNKIGTLKIKLDKDLKIDRSILNLLDSKIKNYQNYIDYNLNADGNLPGYKKILKYIDDQK